MSMYMSIYSDYIDMGIVYFNTNSVLGRFFND